MQAVVPLPSPLPGFNVSEVSRAAAFPVATSPSSHTHSVFYISASLGSFVTLISACTHVTSAGLGEDGGEKSGVCYVFHGAHVPLFPVTLQVSGTQLALNKLRVEWMNDQINTLIHVIKVFLSGEIFCPD